MQGLQKQQDDNKNNENSCVYCGHFDPNYNENDMIMHYAKDCPMLYKCDFCKKVVEIKDYNYHLKMECPNKDLFRECPRCKEPIIKKAYDQHTSEKLCLVSKNPNIANRCPLCHMDLVPSGNIGWEKHILTDGCSNNPRTQF